MKSKIKEKSCLIACGLLAIANSRRNGGTTASIGSGKLIFTFQFRKYITLNWYSLHKNVRELLSMSFCNINIPRMCHITPVLRELHWLPVQFRIQFKLIIITFKVIKGQGPIYLQELVRLQQSGAYSLRSSNKGLMLQIPNVISKKTLGDRAYMCAAPKLWNSLPCHVRNESDFNKFKILLKTYLFNLAFN